MLRGPFLTSIPFLGLFPVLSLGILFSLASTARSSQAPARTSPSSTKRTFEEIRRDVGQLFIWGLPESDLTPRTLQHFESLRAGAFILFRRDLKNDRQLESLTRSLRDLALKDSGYAPLLAVDQEGGAVTRLSFNPAMPSSRALGFARDPDLAESVGFETGKFLQEKGLNTNLAPVLDLGSNGNSFIASRSFSPDPSVVAELGYRFGLGLLRAGVLPVAKHFPGIGPVTNDPHVSLVRRTVDKEELIKRDFVPFQKFMNLPHSGMMISHLIYPGLDPKELPGTFSEVIGKEWLLKKMKFRGLIVTDDLLMVSTKTDQDFKDNVVKSFKAGSDLMMVSWSFRKQRLAVEALLSALIKGEITQEDLLARANKVRGIKKSLSVTKTKLVPLSDSVLSSLSSDSYLETMKKLARTTLAIQTRKLSLSAFNEISLIRIEDDERVSPRKMQPLGLNGDLGFLRVTEHLLNRSGQEGSLPKAGFSFESALSKNHCQEPRLCFVSFASAKTARFNSDFWKSSVGILLGEKLRNTQQKVFLLSKEDSALYRNHPKILYSPLETNDAVTIILESFLKIVK